MTEDVFDRRGRALEETFFAKKNQELLGKLRQKRAGEITKRDISEATGIDDDELLERLVNLKLNVESLEALSVVPLVEVAWADGMIDHRERVAILEAATEAGIREDGPGYRMLQEWLDDKPDLELLASWKDYVAALAERLDPEAYERVRDNLLKRARKVAEAAGGLLGVGRISAAEEKKLAELAAAFRK